MAAAVQTTYAETLKPGKAGMVANMTDWDADTLIVETDAGIGFGLAVGQGTDPKQAVIGAASAAAFRGISVRDVTLESTDEDKYADGKNMAVLTRGDIWVVTGGDVTAGADVTFAAATGVLSSAAAGGSQFTIAGARWMTTAASGELAIVRLRGPTPAA